MDSFKNSGKKRLPIIFVTILVIGLGISSSYGVFFATQLGPGLSPDSVHYISAAQNLAAGEGYQSTVEGHGTLNRFPPLFSFCMSLADKIGIEAATFVRWLNGFLLASLVVVAAGFHRSIEPGHPVGTLLASLLIAVSPVMLLVHVMAWSEPLFILFTYLFILCMYLYLNHGKTITLVLAVISASAAMLMRFIGVVLPLVALPNLIARWSRGHRNRVLWEAGWLSLTYVPLGIWLWQSSFGSQHLGGRELAFHPITLAQIKQGVFTVAGWLQIPSGLPAAVQGLIILALVAVLLVLASFNRKRRLSSEPGDEIQWEAVFRSGIFFLCIFLVLYLGFLVVSISFIDANTSLDSRILSPVFPGAAILVSLLIGSGLNGKLWSKALSGLLLMFILVWAARSLQINQAEIARSATGGIGFNSIRWRESTTLASAEILPTDLQLYSNSPEAVYLYTGRSAFSLPRRQNLTSRADNSLFEQEVDSLSTKLDRGSAAMIYFDGLANAAWPDLDELTREITRAKSSLFEDGWIVVNPEVVEE